MSDLTAVSLFAGIGGIDRALELAGVQVTAAVEIDPDCQGVLHRHFPRTAIFNDVTEVTGDQLRATGFVPERGILAGGWPCQGNSVAGRRGGMADPRSGLWRHVVRLLAETRPRWFLGENVPGLLSVGGGRDFGAVLGDLDDLGYGVAWRVLDAQFFGVPQRRRRLFLVGRLGDPLGPVEVLLEPEGGTGHPAAGAAAAKDVAGTLGSRAGGSRATDLDGHGAYVVSALQGGGRRGHRIDAEGAAGGHLVPFPVALRGREDGSQIEVGDPGDPAFTVRTPGGGSSHPMIAAPMAFNPQTGGSKARLGYGETPTALQANPITAVVIPVDMRNAARETEAGETAGTGIGADGDPSFTLSATARALPGVAAGMQVRRLTPLECERLQGFPDEWTAGQSDSARYRELGNSVAVPCVGWITRRIAAVEARLATARGAA